MGVLMWLIFAIACTPENTFDTIEDTDVKVVYPSGEPDIFVEQEAIDFGTIPQTGEAHRPLTISNQGGGRLNVYAITIRDSTAITIDSEDDFFLDGGESLDLGLIWTPAGEWPLSSTIEVKSNDPDERIVEVPCQGGISD
jgi:hypothetical protein